MSRELLLTAGFTFDDGQESVVTAAVLRRFQNITTKRPSRIVQGIPTTAAGTEIALGSAAALGGAILVVNLDPTNFVTIYRTTGPIHAIAILRPDTDSDGNGGFWMCTALGADLLAPYAVADTATCDILIATCPP